MDRGEPGEAAGGAVEAPGRNQRGGHGHRREREWHRRGGPEAHAVPEGGGPGRASPPPAGALPPVARGGGGDVAGRAPRAGRHVGELLGGRRLDGRDRLGPPGGVQAGEVRERRGRRRRGPHGEPRDQDDAVRRRQEDLSGPGPRTAAPRVLRGKPGARVRVGVGGRCRRGSHREAGVHRDHGAPVARAGNPEGEKTRCRFDMIAFDLHTNGLVTYTV